MGRTANKSQHTKLTLEKKILPPLLPGFELAIFRSRVRRFNQRAIPVWNNNDDNNDNNNKDNGYFQTPVLKSSKRFTKT